MLPVIYNYNIMLMEFRSESKLNLWCQLDNACTVYCYIFQFCTALNSLWSVYLAVIWSVKTYR